MTQPKLGHRAIDAYNRLCREVAAYNYVLRETAQKGPVGWETLMALNGMVILANRLFRRHADLPRFLPVNVREPMSQADFAVLITRLTAACIHFEEHYAPAQRQASGSGQPEMFRHYAAVTRSRYRR